MPQATAHVAPFAAQRPRLVDIGQAIVESLSGA
jgi:hypothetical protein